MADWFDQFLAPKPRGSSQETPAATAVLEEDDWFKQFELPSPDPRPPPVAVPVATAPPVGPQQRPPPMVARGYTDPESVRITPPIPQRGMSAEGWTDPASVRITPAPVYPQRPVPPPPAPPPPVRARATPGDIALPSEPAAPVAPPPPTAPSLRHTLSPEGADAIKTREGGFYAEPYQDGGALAIGYGMQTWKGRRVTPDLRVTEEEADAELQRQVETDKGRIVDNALKVPVTQNQYDALVSIAWNLPAGALRIINRLNAGEQPTEADFLASATVDGRPHEGLQNRRRQEFASFMQEPAGVTPPSARVAPPPVAALEPQAQPAKPAPELHVLTRAFLEKLRDVGVFAAKGAIGAVEGVVGMADIATVPNRLLAEQHDTTFRTPGQFLEDTVNFKPEAWKKSLDEYFSDQQKAANRTVQEARGPVNIAIAALSNPSVITGSVIESLPLMAVGGVIGRTILKGAPLAGGFGEGLTGMGSAAEQSRQDNPDGQDLTGGQAALAVSSGAFTTAIGVFGKRLADYFQVADVDTLLAAGVKSATARAGLVRQVLLGAFQEGFLEELPQSVSEQVHANIAAGRPISTGVDAAMVMGALAGSVMGMGAQLVEYGAPAAPPAVQPPPATPPPAVDDVVTPPEAAAGAVETPPPTPPPPPTDPPVVDEPVAPPPVAPPVTPTLPDNIDEMTEEELVAWMEAQENAENAPSADPVDTPPVAGESAETQAVKEPETHKFSSTQFDMPDDVAEGVRALAATIPDEHLEKDGREDAPHLTLKYGLHTANVDDIRPLIANWGPIEVTLGETSYFPEGESGNGDVVKIDVSPASKTILSRLNQIIADGVEVTDTHPTYRPHITVAYVKKGMGAKYAGNMSLQGRTVTIDMLTFTSKDGSVTHIPLNGRTPTQLAADPHWYTNAHYAQPARPPVSPLDYALIEGLHGIQGAKARLEILQQRGATDDELTLALGKEFGLMGSGLQGRFGVPYYTVRGGEQRDKPSIELSDSVGAKGQKIAGKKLLRAVRDLFGIAQPGVSSGGTSAPETSTPPPGPQPGDPRGERPPTPKPGAGPRRSREDRTSERARLRATEDEDGLNDLLEIAKAGGFTGDEPALRAALQDRLALLHELNEADSGHDPLVLLQAIADLGGISLQKEQRKTEIKWLQEFQDNFGTVLKPKHGFGYARGVKGVFNNAGLSLDDLFTSLTRQDSRFYFLTDLDAMFDAIRDAMSAPDAGSAIQQLKKGLGEKWWTTINLAVADPVEDNSATEGDDSFDIESLEGRGPPVVDTLDTGEDQTRLPGTEGVRQPGTAPTFKAPVQASGDDFADSFGKEPEPPPPAGPGLFEPPAAPSPPKPGAATRAQILADLRARNNDAPPDGEGPQFRLTEEPHGYDRVGPHLTEDEREALRIDHARRMVAVFDALPPDADYMAAAQGGAVMRQWYEDAAAALRTVFGEVDAPRFAALLAALSPRVSVAKDLENTVRVWGAWTEAGRPTDEARIRQIVQGSIPGQVLGAWGPNAVRALSADDPTLSVLSGAKVNSFFGNLIGRWHEVTNDGWMAAFAAVDANFLGGEINKAQTKPGKGATYLALSAKIRRVATRLTEETGERWTPAQVQAAVWSWSKTLVELAASEGTTAEDLIRTGRLTDEALLATPNVGGLLSSPDTPIRSILEAAGYGPILEAFDADRSREVDRDDRQSRQGRGRAGARPGRPRHRAPTIGALRPARRLDRNNPTTEAPQFSRVPLYSALTRAAEGLTQQKGSPEQMLAMLVKAKGVKQEELDLSGIKTWLSSTRAGKPVTKTEILEYLRANELHLEEVLLGDQHPDLIKKEGEQYALMDEIEKARAKAFGPGSQGNEEGQIPPQVIQNVARWSHNQYDTDNVTSAMAARKGLTALRLSPDRLAAINEYGKLARQSHLLNEEVMAMRTPTQYGSQTNLLTPGGENQRELLIRLPDKPQPDYAALARAFQMEMAAKYGADPDILLEFDPQQFVTDMSDRDVVDHKVRYGEWNALRANMTAAERARESELLKPIQPTGGNPPPIRFTAGHYSSHPNVVVHIRFNERIGPNGEKILFVEEVQSDWHQQGRRKGYARPPLTANDLRVERGELEWLVHVPDKATPLRIGMGTVASEAEAKEYAVRYLNQDDRMSQRVPDAPFKTTWQELAMKRVLVYAAQHGYDQVAWTTGEQQNERYDLSKQVKEITWRHMSSAPEVIAVSIETLGDRADIEFDVDVNGVVLKDNASPDARTWGGAPLENVIGKDVATKIMSERTGRLAGDGLKVGGSGMRGFYDHILPAFLNKFGKPFGARVEDVTLAATPGTQKRIGESILIDEWEVVTREVAEDAVLDRGLGAVGVVFEGDDPELVDLGIAADEIGYDVPPGQWDLYDFLQTLYDRGYPEPLTYWVKVPTTPAAPGVTVHGFTITPQLQQVASEGLPLFARDDFEKLRRRVVNDQAALAAAYASMPMRQVGRQPVAVYDTGTRFTPEELTEVLETPGMGQLTDAITSVLDQVLTVVMGEQARPAVERVGLLFDRRAFGVFFPDPAATARGRRRVTILINPLHYLKPSDQTPLDAAKHLYETIVHEATHWQVSGEGLDFVQAYATNIQRLKAEAPAVLRQLTEAYADPDRPRALRPDLARALSIYTESRGRRGRAGDALGRAGGYERRSPDEPDGPDQAPDDVRRDRGGTPPQAVTTADRVALVRLVKSYIHDLQITDFATIVHTFREDYGPGADKLNRALELAWLALRKETVSVAAVLKAGQNRPGGAPDGTQSERPVAGGRPAGAGDAGDAAGGAGSQGPRGVAGEQPVAPEGVSGGPPGEGGSGDGGAVRVPPVLAGEPPPAGDGTPPPRDGGVHRPGAVDPAEPSDGTKEADARGAAPRSFVIDNAEALTELSTGWIQKLDDNMTALRLLKQLEQDGRMASAEEQAVLARYIGWGHTGLAAVVDPRNALKAKDPRQKAAREALQNLLTAREFRALGDSTVNAHYSFSDLPRAMWALVERLGFRGGSVLEPAVGTGHFFGTMPGAIRGHALTRLFGVDMEPVAAAIAHQLYQEASVQNSPLQEAVLPDEYFDLQMSNVPFGALPVFDPSFVSSAKRLMTKSLHNYYFGKALDKARPGGLIVFVTSRYTMDSQSDVVRQYINERATFLGAFRLPETAFAKTAGTHVVADVIVLMKHEEGRTHTGPAWLASKERDNVPVPRYAHAERPYTNEYFIAHPEMVLGTEAMTGKTQDVPNQYNVEGELTPEMLAAAVARLPQNAYRASKYPPRTLATHVPVDAKQGSFVLEKGKLYTYDKGTLVPSDLKGKALARATLFIPIRDAYQAVLDAMTSNADALVFGKAQAELTRTYDAFVKAHGYVNKRENARVIGMDPNGPRVLGLEEVEWVKEAKGRPPVLVFLKKAEIFDAEFEKRPIRPPTEPTTAATPSDALVQSLAWRGTVDMTYMAGLTGKTEAELIKGLGKEIYRNPDTGVWQTAEEYLSGDVVTKLTQAEAAAGTDATFARNVEALQAIQPPPLNAEDFDAPFGATWVPTSIYEEFFRENGADPDFAVRLVNNALRTTWYTDGSGTHDLLPDTQDLSTWADHALNGKLPVIKKWVGTGDNAVEVVDPKATEEYRQTLKQLREEWKTWWLGKSATADQITTIYNAMFNREVARSFDGSRLIVPNANPEIALRPWQKNVVWRMLQAGNTLLAHAVGSGKTYAMIAAAGEMKRLGLARKPMIVVPNHLLDYWQSTFVRYYPGARILVTQKSEFDKKNRQRLVARMANNDWDAVIVPQSQFLAIGVSVNTLRSFIEQQEAVLLAEGAAAMEMTVETFEALVSAKEAGDPAAARALRRAEESTKDIVRAIIRLRTRLQKRLDQQDKDAPIEFEKLGVDALFVDEAHLFKNLFFSTGKNGIVGLKPSDAGRAMDMFLKVRLLNQASNNRNVFFATGTPVSNAVAELYTMFRYLAQPTLDRLGMSGFDSWANNYAEASAVSEPAPGGGYKERLRLRSWANLRELSKLFRRFADVVTTSDLIKSGLLKLPKLKNGKPTVVALDAHPDMPDFLLELQHRIEDIKGGGVDPKDDNNLKITTEASLAAIDMRLVRPDAADDPNSRLRVAAREVAARYKASKATLGTQLVFLDVGTAKGTNVPPLPPSISGVTTTEDVDEEEVATTDDEDTPDDDIVDLDAEHEELMEGIRRLGADRNLYGELKRLLVAQGIKPDEVAFIHQATNPGEERRLYKAMNDGRIRVLIATTSKGGVGMNVQKRMVALHHLDVPWRPADMEQREGRILRQGNDNAEVEVLRYVTKKSFDEYRWGLLAKKQSFIYKLLRGELTHMEDDDIEVGLEVAAALASGDPRTLRMLDLEREVRGLRARFTNWSRKRQGAQADIDRNVPNAQRLAKEREQLEAFATAAREWEAAPSVTLTKTKGKFYGFDHLSVPQAYNWKDTDARKAFQDAIVAMMEVQNPGGDTIELGTAGPFTLQYNRGMMYAREQGELTRRAGTYYLPMVSVKIGPFQMGATPAYQTDLIEKADRAPQYAKSLDAYLDAGRVEEHVKLRTVQLDRIEHDNTVSVALLSKPFTQQQELDTKERELYDLRVALGVERALDTEDQRAVDDYAKQIMASRAAKLVFESVEATAAREEAEKDVWKHVDRRNLRQQVARKLEELQDAVDAKAPAPRPRGDAFPRRKKEGPNAQRFFAGQDRVVAKRRIAQNPAAGAPAVPAGREGLVQDVADDLLWVDFGEPYGTVAVDDNEVAPASPTTDALPGVLPMPPVRSAPAGTPRRVLTEAERRALRPDQIIQRIAEAIGNIPLSVGQVRGNLGIFKGEGVIRTQIRGDFRVQLHELGHAIDRLLEPFSATHKRGLIAKELRSLGQPTSLPSYTVATQRAEGVANYMVWWMMEPAAARAAAPHFTLAFESWIAGNISRQPTTPPGSGLATPAQLTAQANAEAERQRVSKRVGQIVAEAQGQMQQWLALTPGEQYDTFVDFNDGRPPEWAEHSVAWALGTYEDPRTGWSRMVSALSDDKHRLWEMELALKNGVVEPGESVYWLTRILPGAVRRAEGFIKYKVRDEAGTILGPSLTDAITPVLGKYKQLVKYLVAKRAQRAQQRGLETGMTKEQLAAGLAYGNDRQIQVAALGINAFRGAFLDYLQLEGFLPAQTRRSWEKAWGDTYVPFKRVGDALKTYMTGAPRHHARLPRFFKRFVGAHSPVLDPLVTMIEDVYAGVAAAMENKATKEMMIMARQQKMGGPWIEILDQQRVPITFNLSEVKATILAELAKQGVDVPTSVQLDPDLFDQFVTIWTPAKLTFNGKHYITALNEDGTRTWAEVHDLGLWEMIDRNLLTANIGLGLMHAFSASVRATATLNVPWMMRNIWRDFQAATAYAPGLYTPMDTFRGLKSVLFEDEDWQLFLHSGAGQATFNAQDRDVFKRQLRQFNKGKLRTYFNMITFHPFDTLAALRELSEQATRVGGFKMQLKIERASPLGLTDAGLRRAAIVGREITQDFQKIGSTVRRINHISAFTAARIGGVTRATEEAKARPAQLALRVAPYIAMSIALWLINHADDEYDAIPSDQKRLFHHIRIPQVLRDQGWGAYLMLPRAFEYGDIANAIEAYLDWQVDRDPQFKDRLPKFNLDGLMEFVLSVMPDMAVAPAEILANYDTFRLRNIFNPYDTDLDPQLQYNRWTSETAKGLGRITGWEPWKWDHLLASYGTGVYRMMAGALDRTMSEVGLIPDAPERVSGVPSSVEGAVVELRRAFYAGEAVGTADIDQFYTELERLEGAVGSIHVYLKGGQIEQANQRAGEEGLTVTRRPNGEDIVNSPRLRALRQGRDQMRDIRGPFDEIHRSTVMTPAEKRAALNELGERVVNLARFHLGKGELTRTTTRAQQATAP
jgi:N12 class adenine-specific DNA methylase/GH24 family phage-related lysozyme (muramidase)/2'-5' RNA ligase